VPHGNAHLGKQIATTFDALDGLEEIRTGLRRAVPGRHRPVPFLEMLFNRPALKDELKPN